MRSLLALQLAYSHNSFLHLSGSLINNIPSQAHTHTHIPTAYTVALPRATETAMGYLALPAPFTRRSQRAGCAGYTPLPLSPTPSSSAASIASTGSWDSGDDESSSSLVHDCELGCDRRSDDLDPPPSSAPASTSLSTAARIAHSIPGPLRDLAILLPALVFFSGVGTLFAVFPFPTTVHAFIPLALALASWVALSWLKLGWGALRALRRRGPVGAKKTMSDVVPGMVVGGARQRRRSVTHLTALLACTALVVYWLSLGLVPPKQEIPALAPAEDRPRYFIAANLYNNEHLVPRWSSQVLKLVNHCECSLVVARMCRSGTKCYPTKVGSERRSCARRIRGSEVPAEPFRTCFGAVSVSVAASVAAYAVARAVLCPGGVRSLLAAEVWTRNARRWASGLALAWHGGPWQRIHVSVVDSWILIPFPSADKVLTHINSGT